MPDPLGSPVANPIPLVVIPCLNEAEHIARVAQQMLAAVARHGGHVVVVDGGSTDGPAPSSPTWRARRRRLRLLDNPARRQASAVNAAVAALGGPHAPDPGGCAQPLSRRFRRRPAGGGDWRPARPRSSSA
jgi:hypothetical protein